VTGDVDGRIRRAIGRRGSIRFDEFMELALYAPGGYYERPPVGPKGDFVTSPHVHWWFAYALGAALGSLGQRLGAGRPVRLVELGAGDGTLARTLIEILADAGPIEYTAVEESSGAREALAGAGVTVAASLDEVPSLDGALLFANELLDNLPFRRVRRRDDRLVEVRVGLAGDRFVEVEAPPDPELDAALDVGSSIARLDPGAEVAVPTGALDLVDRLAERMRDGYALFIDYSAELGRAVHGYRRQRATGDVLEHPGAADITAGVDFDAVERRAQERGLLVLGRVTQREALLALGFAEWAAGERERQASLRAGGRAAEATRAWSARSRATLLVEPNGLGAHRWLLLAAGNLAAPEWMSAAKASRGV
jgi:NADH dehydrogenase [ubiquinone] 1 alpha subcomplex assembly factor 7